MPGRRSTPELTSTTSGRTRATASATVSGVSPPASTIVAPASRGARLAGDGQVERNAAAARRVRHPGLDQDGVGVARRFGQSVEIVGGRDADARATPRSPAGAEPGGIALGA